MLKLPIIVLSIARQPQCCSLLTYRYLTLSYQTARCPLSFIPACCIILYMDSHWRLVLHSNHSCRVESTVAFVTETSVLSMVFSAMRRAACNHWLWFSESTSRANPSMYVSYSDLKEYFGYASTIIEINKSTLSWKRGCCRYKVGSKSPRPLSRLRYIWEINFGFFLDY